MGHRKRPVILIETTGNFFKTYQRPYITHTFFFFHYINSYIYIL